MSEHPIMSITDSIKGALKPIAKRVLFQTVQPNGITRRVLAGISDAAFVSREVYEWAQRSLVATPMFLSKCAVFGDQIAVDRMPYMLGNTRIELGSNIRISGKIGITSPHRGEPVLQIGDGVFIGHNCAIAIAERVSIGRFASIGSGTYIADTEGHSHYNPERPIWEVPAGDADVAPVTIQDNVQISKNCMILKGVTIGARSVVGAGSVVRSDIPPDSIVMGNPARVVKRMTAQGA
jgi:acetyltransferase-like isoleucine patch superfamily enzyme